MELLAKIRRLGNAAPLETYELEKLAADWQFILEDVVPVDLLPVVYKRAVLNHPNAYLVNAFDILREYRELQTEQAAIEKNLRADEEKMKNPIELCGDFEKHANESGDVEICNPVNWNETILLPCRTCRPKAYAAQRALFVAKNGGREQTINDLPIDKIGVKKDFVNLKDPNEIINRWIVLVNKEMVRIIGTEEYENARQIWLTLMNMRKYVGEMDK